MNFEILKNNKFKVHRFDLGIVLMKENYYIVNNYSVNSAQVFGFLSARLILQIFY